MRLCWGGVAPGARRATPAPRELAFRESVAGRVVHERHFDVVHLWELGYTATQLARVIPEEVVMASSLFDKAIAKGIEKGRLDEARHVCMEFVKRHHPEVAARVQPAIAACSDVTRLHRWTLRVPEVSAADLLRLVTASQTPRPSRRRAPRPSRRSRSTAAR